MSVYAIITLTQNTEVFIMFRKLFSLLLVLAFFCPFAISESWEAPAIKNPQDAYDYYVEETDGSDQMIFGMIDLMNEELATAQEYGAVRFDMSYVDTNGEPLITVTNYLQLSEYGNVHIIETTAAGEQHFVYNIGTNMYHLYGDKIEATPNGYTLEEADWFWNSYVFPFGNLEVMNGMRQDENGYSYFLIKSDDSMSFEYVVGDSMKIKQLRVYYADGKGNLELAIIVDYGVCPAQPLPEALTELLKQNAGTTP